MRIFDLAFHDLTADDAKQLEQSESWGKTLVVREDMPAETVGAIADLNAIDLVVVVDPVNVVRGCLTRSGVIEQTARHLTRGRPPGSLSAAFAAIEGFVRPNPRGFDWLNNNRPKLRWCNPGNHLTSYNPCPDHGG